MTTRLRRSGGVRLRRLTTNPSVIHADAAALSQKIVLEAVVASGRAREAALDARIAELETQNKRVAEIAADNASLTDEVTELRKRPRPSPPPAALQHLMWLLGGHEQDLRDLVFELVRPRHLAKCQRELPENPGGSLGEFAVTVPTGTVRVDADAFMGCAGLAQITLPVTAKVLEEGGGSFRSDNDNSDDEEDDEGEEHGAFSGCTSLVTLPPNLTQIEGWAFYGCTSLSNITLPPTLTEIGQSAFFGCTSLSEITLPANLTKIGASAFSYCTSLSEITLPPTLTEIGEYTFFQCTSLCEIMLPAGAGIIGSKCLRRLPQDAATTSRTTVVIDVASQGL